MYLWQKPKCLIKFDNSWHQIIEYVVDDFLAEVGFYSNILGLVPSSLGQDYAKFSNRELLFFISFVPSSEERPATPPDSVHIQLLVKDMKRITWEFKQRGVRFIRKPEQMSEDMSCATIITPGGMILDFWIV